MTERVSSESSALAASMVATLRPFGATGMTGLIPPPPPPPPPPEEGNVTTTGGGGAAMMNAPVEAVPSPPLAAVSV